MVSFSRLILLVGFSCFLGACSGGGSATPDFTQNESTDGGNGPNNNGTNNTGRTLLPTAGQANTVGLQLAQSSDGAVHATYADIEGRIFYARCNTNCGQNSAWQSVEIDEVDVGFSGYAVPRIELDSRSRPRIAFHVVPGSFDPGNTHFAYCDTNCLNSASWESEAVIGHGGNMLEFRLSNTDWFALTPTGGPVISYLLQNSLIDTDKRLRLLSCETNCTLNENWSQRIVANYSITLGRPVHIDVGPDGQYNLAVHIEGIGSDVATLTWFGCSSNCLTDGAWTNGVELETVDADLNSLPDVSLSIADNGNSALLSYDDTDQSSLTLFECSGECSRSTDWLSQDINDRINVAGGIFDAGYGVDLRFNGNIREVVFAAKASNSPLRQLIVASSCDSQCATIAGTWNSRVLARTDEQLPDEAICIFIGTRVSSALSSVPGAVGFTASPQWACGLEPVLVTGPDGESYYDNASDIRFLQLSTVVTY